MKPSTPSLIVTLVPADRLVESDYNDWAKLDSQQESPANPFLHPAWVMAWFQHYVEPANRWIALVREVRSDALVGLVPFHLQNVRVGPATLARRLMPVGAGVGPNPYEIPGLLTAPGMARDVCRAVVTRTMASDADWCELAITPEQGWFEPEWTYGSNQPVTFGDHQRPRACVVLPLASTWEATRTGLKRNLKESLRRSQNRLAKDGREVTVAHRQGTAVDRSSVGRFLDLHRLRSNNQQATVQHNDAFSDPRSRSMVLSVIPELATQGRASIFELILDGSLVASQLALHAGGCSYVHSSGFEPESWALGPVTYLHAELVKAAIDRGDTIVNFSPGPNVSKLRWSEQLWVSNEFAYGSGPKSLGARYSAYQAISAVRSSASAIKFAGGSSRFRRRQLLAEAEMIAVDHPTPSRMVDKTGEPVAALRVS